jgi:hypothetical protein
MAEVEGTFIDKNGCKRDSNGRLVAGSKTPNPSGRPKGIGYVREIAQNYTEDAIRELYSIMTTSEKDRDRLEAAKYLLDRGWGKPSTSVEIQHENGDSQTKMIELSKLSKDQLEQLEDMIDIAKESQGEGDE